jgi:endoglucanase
MIPLSRRSFVASLASTTLALPSLALGQAPGAASRLGVSLAGPEFGTQRAGFSNLSPGTVDRDYTYNKESTYTYFCKQGLKLLRIPVRWERLQPKLGQELDEAQMKLLQTAIGWTRQHGGSAIIDVHNYGRYYLKRPSGVRECIIDEVIEGSVRVSREHFADLWGRLAKAFKDEAAVVAYGLMNEPHDMGASSWKAISQGSVDAIRQHDKRKLILVAGDDWSSAPRFVRANGPRAWVKDPADNVAYEAHCYFDRDGSGKYKLSYQDELRADSGLASRGVERLIPFVGWCRVNQVRGFLGEFGCPADPAWLKVLAEFLKALGRAEMAGCWWAAGEWWKDYPLSLQPRDDFRTAARQLPTLLNALADK